MTNPVVGEGATILWSLVNFPATVIKVSKDGKSCTIREDRIHSIRDPETKKLTYSIEPNPAGEVYIIRFKDGKWLYHDDITPVLFGQRKYLVAGVKKI